jgi:DNA-binding MarR family transcriptional regulator
VVSDFLRGRRYGPQDYARFFLLYDATLRWRRRHGFGTDASQHCLFVLLRAAFDGEPADVKTLTFELDTHRRTLVPLLLRLERRGLIERQTGPDDRRRRLATLTPDGIQATLDLVDEVMDLLNTLWSAE